MNLNKNISIWRGDSTPPTNYHFWIKSNGNIFINSGTQFKDYKELSGIKDEITLNKNLSIKDATVTRSRDRIYINLNRYKGFPVSLQLDFATHDQAGIMSVPDKEVVDKANYVITAEPIVGNLSVDAKGNQVSVGYLYVEGGNNSVSESVHLPLATITSAGLLSKEDKNKLDLLDEDIAEVEITGFTKELSPNKVTLKLESANQILSLDLNEVTTTKAGVMSATDKTKLDTLDWYFEE